MQAEDGLLHFRWYERVGTSETKGSAQHDTIIFPGEATFTKVQLQDNSFEDSLVSQVSTNTLFQPTWLTLLQVASAGASARIYSLGFPQDKSRALFFW